MNFLNRLINFFRSIFINKITFIGYTFTIIGIFFLEFKILDNEKILIPDIFVFNNNENLFASFLIIVGVLFLGATSFGLHSFVAFEKCKLYPKRFIKIYQNGPYCERCIASYFKLKTCSKK